MLTRLEILPNAIFIADAHYSKTRPQFLEFLKQIYTGKIVASQLFLLGDCFDFLSSSNAYSVLANRKAVSLLKKISKQIPTFYFEGNHDFNLKKIFKQITIFDFRTQPVIFSYKNQNIALLHGDRFESWHYRLYTFFVRNDTLLRCINLLSLQYKHNMFVKKLYSFLENKSICQKKDSFLNWRVDKIIQVIKNMDIDVIVEGHFHQNTQSNTLAFCYINLSAFACDKSFFKVQSLDIFRLTEIVLKEEL